MKKITFIVLSLIGFLSMKGQAPNFEWAKQMEGNWHSFSYDIQLDTLGNVYTAGNFLGTTDFDPGPGTYSLTAAGSCDAYVSKMDPSGNLLWAVAMGSTDNDYAYTVKTDKNNNVYIGGQFDGTVDFDPGSGVYNLNSLTDNSFVVKLNSNGNFIWAKQLHTYHFSVDEQGNITASNIFSGVRDFDPGSGVYNLSSVYNSIGVSKLDSSGNFLWAASYAESAFPAPINLNAITTDRYGNTYSVGTFEGTFDFDPGAAVLSFSTNNSEDMFVSKFNASGNFVWAKQFTGTTSFNDIVSITVDKNCNVYTTGHFTHIVDFDPGLATHYLNSTTTLDAETFVSKLDSSGNFVLAKSMGGSDLDGGQSIAVDQFENIYTSGYFRGTSDFDPSAGVYNLSAPWPANVFLSKLNPQGNFAWAVTMGGDGSDYAYSNAVDKAGNLYTTGWFQDSVDFDPGVNAFYLKAPGGLYQGYVHKMSVGQVGIQEINKTTTINVYPNPTTGILNIAEGYLNKKTKIEIYSSLGTLVFEKIEEETKTVDLSPLSNGIYFVKIMGDNQLMKTQKIIKQ